MLSVVAAFFFEVSLSKPTASRYMAELHITEKLTSHRTTPKGLSRGEYVSGYFDYAKSLHDSGFLSVARENLGCADFFYQFPPN